MRSVALTSFIATNFINISFCGSSFLKLVTGTQILLRF
jgi:hypothetical protein